MPEQIEQQEAMPTEQHADGGAPLGTPPPAQAAADPVQQRSEPKTVVVPTSAMKRIKEEEFARGQQGAMDELAKSAGYSSHTELVQALSKLKQTPAAQQQQVVPQRQAQQPAAEEPNEDPARDLANAKDQRREEGKYQRQLEKVLNERNRYASSASEWQRKAREFQADADAARAEMHIRTIAAQTGVQDIDYAIILFSREVERLTPEEAEKFDEKAYFETLRKSKPLLFGEAVVPANTGTGVGGAPKPPAPAAVRAQNGANGAVDVRKMSPQDYQAHLAKKGISPHSH
jgi:hypothetical protein